MERIFLLKGLDCPNCSAKIEKEVGDLENVNSSSVNLMKQTLTIQTETFDNSIVEQIETIVHSHEPDVEVSEKKESYTTKTYLLKGLDCPNCSAKIEKEVGDLEDVSSSVVNLMKQTLTISVKTSASGKIQDEVATIVHSHEPDVKVSEQTDSYVTKKYLLKGLDCPNCSAKIEKEVGELEGVALSEVNLMKQTLTVSMDHNKAASMLDMVTTIVHSHEPDVEVSEQKADTSVAPDKKEKTPVYSDDDKKLTIRLISGAVIYAVGMGLTLFGHSSFVANKLGLENLILLSGDNCCSMQSLKTETFEFFKKVAGYDTLRLILCKKSILVEGDSDELVVQRAYMDTHEGRLPIQDGIDVMTVGGVTFKRYLEIAQTLNKETAVVTDNDGNIEAVKKKYKEYEEIQCIHICVDEVVDTGDLKLSDKDFNYNTLEPKILKENGREAMNNIFGTNYDTDDEMHKYMHAHKTDCAIAIFESATKIKYPEYIMRAIKNE